ncbi:hypothetical protein LOK49_LG02G04044 [Camellia lanceoleosa]|uniref:Uncharacterized protein n=1 Tax=Camellia lanceoleosa TaxID=1840588 RepID=A0ACC0IM73_9ERIC|nr:hypothetical protein LOK49_LG02G04044 [Camellia lanceoleosa]
MEAMHAPIFFERYDVHGDMKSMPSEVIEWIRKNKICLKGGFKTPVSGGVSSLNVQLRKELDLYASLVNCFNLPGLPTRHEDVDIVVVRENRTPRGSTRASSTRSSKASSGDQVSVTSGNVGADHAVFEQGALAGNVGNEKILEQKKANPVALLLSSAMMLRHLQFPSFTDRLETSVKCLISEGKYRTKDLGGDSTPQEVVDAIIANLD